MNRHSLMNWVGSETRASYTKRKKKKTQQNSWGEHQNTQNSEWETYTAGWMKIKSSGCSQSQREDMVLGKTHNSKLFLQIKDKIYHDWIWTLNHPQLLSKDVWELSSPSTAKPSTWEASSLFQKLLMSLPILVFITVCSAQIKDFKTFCISS